MDGRSGGGGSRAEHHAGPPVDPVELLCVVGEAGGAGGEPRGQARTSAPPPRAAEADPGRVHHGCSRRGGGEGPPSATRRGDLPDPSLHGHAARVGGDVARPAPRWDLGSARRPGQGREDPRYSPSSAVMQFLQAYVERVLGKQIENVGPEIPLFWSTWGRRGVGTTRAPMTGKNIWRLCKVYGRLIGCPELKPHDLRFWALPSFIGWFGANQGRVEHLRHGERE